MDKLVNNNISHYTIEGLMGYLHKFISAYEIVGDDEGLIDNIQEIMDEIHVRCENPIWYISLEEQINYIIRWTDFEKIHQAMVALNWTWWGEGTPSIERLKNEAKIYLSKVASSEETGYSEYFYSSGGFTASKRIYNGLPTLKLIFTVSGWEFDNEDVVSTNYDWDDEAVGADIRDVWRGR